MNNSIDIYLWIMLSNKLNSFVILSNFPLWRHRHTQRNNIYWEQTNTIYSVSYHKDIYFFSLSRWPLRWDLQWTYFGIVSFSVKNGGGGVLRPKGRGAEKGGGGAHPQNPPPPPPKSASVFYKEGLNLKKKKKTLYWFTQYSLFSDLI